MRMLWCGWLWKSSSHVARVTCYFCVAKITRCLLIWQIQTVHAIWVPTPMKVDDVKLHEDSFFAFASKTLLLSTLSLLPLSKPRATLSSLTSFRHLLPPSLPLPASHYNLSKYLAGAPCASDHSFGQSTENAGRRSTAWNLIFLHSCFRFELFRPEI